MPHLEPETIIDYVHHALSPEQDAQTFLHIQGCADCRSVYEAELSLVEVLQEHAAAEEREMPDSLRAAILANVKKSAGPTLSERFSGWLRPALISAGAAAAAVVFALSPHGAVDSPAGHAKAVMASAFFSNYDAASSDSALADHAGAPSIESSAFVNDGDDLANPSAD